MVLMKLVLCFPWGNLPAKTGLFHLFILFFLHLYFNHRSTCQDEDIYAYSQQALLFIVIKNARCLKKIVLCLKEEVYMG